MFAGDENATEPIRPQCYRDRCARHTVFKITLMYYSLRVGVYANYRSIHPPGHHGLITTTTQQQQK